MTGKGARDLGDIARTEGGPPAAASAVPTKGQWKGLEAAFARPAAQLPNGAEFGETGMTKREYIATALCAGMLSDPCRAGPFADFVHRAVKAADLLLEELAK